nr:hypothetical protein B0A51_10546 [Rachicladosporium sp. CCFEE 5018]
MADPARRNIGKGPLIVFHRLIRFYKTFLILSTLISALSASALQFPEFHPADSNILRVAEGFFVSSTSTAVIAAMVGTMLLFRYDGHQEATLRDLILAWTPLIILDWSIISFLGGIILWYVAQNPDFRSWLVGSSTGLLLLFALWLSADMFIAMKRPGGLGKEELEYLDSLAAQADKDGKPDEAAKGRNVAVHSSPADALGD